MSDLEPGEPVQTPELDLSYAVELAAKAHHERANVLTGRGEPWNQLSGEQQFNIRRAVMPGVVAAASAIARQGWLEAARRLQELENTPGGPYPDRGQLELDCPWPDPEFEAL